MPLQGMLHVVLQTISLLKFKQIFDIYTRYSLPPLPTEIVSQRIEGGNGEQTNGFKSFRRWGIIKFWASVFS